MSHRHRVPGHCAAAIFFGIALFWNTCAVAEDARPVDVETIPVQFYTQSPEQTRFGRLEWRGGFEIVSDDRAFGGYSGIVVSPDGTRLLAVSDKGRWLSASMVYEDGMLASVSSAQTAPVLGANGSPLAGKNSQDAEGLTALPGDGVADTVFMALEREERILRFDFGAQGFAAVPELITLPEEAALGPFNKELEAIAALSPSASGGTQLLAFSERHLDDAGNIIGWLVGDSVSGRVTVVRSDDYDLTDATVLPDGDLLLLERRLSALMLAGMRMRRIAREDIGPGAVLDGEVLLEANQPLATIDNMEALAVHVAHDGEMRLTIMSDDNFNPIQRTLLLQFALPE